MNQCLDRLSREEEVKVKLKAAENSRQKKAEHLSRGANMSKLTALLFVYLILSFPSPRLAANDGSDEELKSSVPRPRSDVPRPMASPTPQQQQQQRPTAPRDVNRLRQASSRDSGIMVDSSNNLNELTPAAAAAGSGSSSSQVCFEVECTFAHQHPLPS